MDSLGSSKRLRLRKADNCARCGHEFAVGDAALWYREARVVTCIECQPDVAAEPVDVGIAGASALRKYERDQQKREAYAREHYGKAGVVLARAIKSESRKTWKRGADGEIHVAKRLEKLLAGSDVKLLHDRLAPESKRANIDHLAVGPGGVTVIDTKNYKGKVQVTWTGGLFSPKKTILEIKGRDRTALVTAVEDQVARIRRLLADSEFAYVDIQGALCFANVDGLPLLGKPQLRSVTIDGARRVSKLANRPGDLDAGSIERLWSHLGRGLPPA